MTLPNGAFPRFLAPVPQAIQEAIDRAALVGGGALEGHDFDAAFRIFSELYRLMVESQPEGKRLHKGMPLHNMGLARLLQGSVADGFNYTLLAFAEDALSAGDERLSTGDEFRRPAAGNLLSIFGVRYEQLETAAQRLRDLGAREPWRTPEQALQVAGVQATVAMPPQPTQPAPRIVGQFGSEWRDRVFVGGAYRLFANMNEIKKIVKRAGFDAVMASDFNIPKDLNHHHALLLLHECRIAIFEISIEAGQLMELERARDYEIDPKDILVLAMAATGHSPSISGMLDALLGRLGTAPVTYQDIGDLPGIIEPWLVARGSGSAAGP